MKNDKKFFQKSILVRRYFARVLDLGLAGVVVGFVLVYLCPTFLVKIQNPVPFSIVIGLAFVFLESLLLMTIGITPGKALFKIYLRKPNNTKFQFQEALKRSFHVYMEGCGFCIPVIFLITSYGAYGMFLKEEETPWDRNGGFEVSGKKLSIFEKIFIPIVVIFLFGGITIAWNFIYLVYSKI